MFDPVMSAELLKQSHAELTQDRERERLARRVTRERKTARVAARRAARKTARRRTLLRPETEVGCPTTAH
jgi:hypothetical protein